MTNPTDSLIDILEEIQSMAAQYKDEEYHGLATKALDLVKATKPVSGGDEHPFPEPTEEAIRAHERRVRHILKDARAEAHSKNKDLATECASNGTFCAHEGQEIEGESGARGAHATTEQPVEIPLTDAPERTVLYYMLQRELGYSPEAAKAKVAEVIRKLGIQEMAVGKRELNAVSHDIRQAWSRISHAMEYYASVALYARKFSGVPGGIAKDTEVGYLASNCMPDVKTLEAYFRQPERV